MVEAAVAYPTDSGLLAKAIGTMARTVARIKAAGGAKRTRSRDRRRSAGQRARSIAAKLKLRGEQHRDQAQAAVRRITGELAGIAEHTMIPAAAMIANAVDDALGLRMRTLPITAEKVALESNGVSYDDVKGSTMGFCFAGNADAYKFHTKTSAKK